MVKTAASVFQELCYNYRDQLMAGIICAGWDRRHGGQVIVPNKKFLPFNDLIVSLWKVFNIPLGGMCVRQPFAIGGSGSTYVFGFVDSNFKKDMTEEECVEFVKKSKLGKLT